MSTAASNRKLPTVQVLRAVAALMVAWLHLSDQVEPYAAYLWPANWPAPVGVMAHGVDIFFVISGFIMLVTSRTMAPGEFMARRIIRIVPLYWFFTLLLAAAAMIKPDLFRSTLVDAQGVIKSLLFIPYFNAQHGGAIWPLLVPGWTLNYEMMFYLLFALALLAPLRWRAALCALAFALIAAASALPGSGQSALLKFYAYPIVFEFVAGMVVGQLYLTRAELPRGASLLLVVAGFGLLVTEALEPPGTSPARILLTHGLPSTLIVLGGVMLDKSAANPREWRLPAALGDASYSIYLSHIFTLGLARKLWEVAGLAQDSALHAWGFAAFGMVAVCVSSLICYRVLEKPALEIGQRGWRALRRGDRVIATV